MASSRYIGKIKEILGKYRRGDYREVERGSCNVCLGRQQGRVLCFYFTSEKSERMEFAHQECLDNLLDEENFRVFVIETREKIREVNLKLKSKSN